MKRIQALREMKKETIHEELRQLLARSISLVVKRKDSKDHKPHLRLQVRKDIARVRTLIAEKGW